MYQEKSTTWINILIIFLLCFLFLSCPNPFLIELLQPFFPEECKICVVIENTASCIEDGLEIRECSKFPKHNEYTKITKALDHNWGDWTVITPATCTETGTGFQPCTRSGCIHTNDNITIPLLGHSMGSWFLFNSSTGEDRRNCQGPFCTYFESYFLIWIDEIINGPSAAVVGIPLPLAGMVLPVNATNQEITWSVQNAGGTGASITGSTLNTTAAGTVTVTATIVNGLASGNYTQNFDITVVALSITINNINDLQASLDSAPQVAVFILSTGTMADSGITIDGKDITLIPEPGTDVTLLRPGVTFPTFTIQNGGKLTLLPNEGGTIRIRGDNSTASGAPLIRVNAGGELVINDGVFITNTRENSNAAITVNGGRITMTGGEISGHIRNGPIRIFDGGSFSMSGGIITGNSHTQSTTSNSMVTVTGIGSSFTMSGSAEISGNAGMTTGGAVRVNSGGTFSMIGGTIRDNRTYYDRDYSTFGGGVFIANGATFTKTGGIIYGREVGAPNWNRIGPTHGNWPGQGAAVYYEGVPPKFRDNTSYEEDYMDTSLNGSEGGWE